MDPRKLKATQDLRLRLFESQRGGLERLIRSSVQSPEDADDLMQEVAVIVLCHDRVPVEERAFGAWCRAVARHLVMHHYRGASRRREVLLEVDEPVFERLKDTRPSAERVLALRELLSNASGSLDESARELLAKRYVEEETSTEIGSRRDESAAGVRVKLARLRAVMRKKLTELDSFPELQLDSLPESQRVVEIVKDDEVPESTTRITPQYETDVESDDREPPRSVPRGGRR